MKRILTALSFMFASNVYAHDTDGFYVIPVPTGEIVDREVCNGTPVGNVAFTIDGLEFSVRTGDIYSTTTGLLVEIVGGYVYYGDGSVSVGFRFSPNTLPQPTIGVKGLYYAIHEGNIVHARLL